jgi:hypothetical protein
MSDNALQYTNDEDLTITSDMEIFDISFWKDKFHLMNTDNYVKFIKGVEKTVRKHPSYTSLISEVRDRLPHCQVLGHIEKNDATIEVHHNLFTLFDICSIVTDSHLIKDEKVNTFMIAREVIDEHYAGHVQLVNLCTTVHQMIDTGEVFINLNQGTGNLNAFIEKYKDAMGRYVDRINEYIDLSKKFKSNDSGIFDLSKKMVNWSYRSLPLGIENLR